MNYYLEMAHCNWPIAAVMSPNFVHQNISNTLQQIQNSNPNHSQISINDLLKTLPNINQPQFTFLQLPIASIPQIQPQPQPIQPNPKPKKNE